MSRRKSSPAERVVDGGGQKDPPKTKILYPKTKICPKTQDLPKKSKLTVTQNHPGRAGLGRRHRWSQWSCRRRTGRAPRRSASESGRNRKPNRTEPNRTEPNGFILEPAGTGRNRMQKRTEQNRTEPRRVRKTKAEPRRTGKRMVGTGSMGT